MVPKKVGLENPTSTSLDPGAEAVVGVTVADLTSIYILDSIKQFGPQKFKQLHVEGVPFSAVLRDPSRLSLGGKRGDTFREHLSRLSLATLEECRQRATRQINAAAKLGASIITYASSLYPANVYRSNNPIPVLYVRGALDVLGSERAVACVGSRGIRSPYKELHEAFALTACRLDHAVVSGFALGADTVGHMAARTAGGRTICCMPGGLDRPFPPENKWLWEALLTNKGAVFVSEFPFGTGASALTLRKRNKLIVAFALGVLVSQSSETGGAMNAYRFAVEQQKPVATFESDGAPDVSGNRLINKKRGERDAVFPLLGDWLGNAPRGDDPDGVFRTADDMAYRTWLQRLSFSI